MTPEGDRFPVDVLDDECAWPFFMDEGESDWEDD